MIPALKASPQPSPKERELKPLLTNRFRRLTKLCIPGQNNYTNLCGTKATIKRVHCGRPDLYPHKSQTSQYLDDPDFLNLMEAASEYGMLVNIHAGEPVGRMYKGKDLTSIRGFYELAKKLPNLKLILAHWGGGLPFYELMPEVKDVMKNVYYETAGTPLLYEMRIFKMVAELAGVEKILFATDFPLLVYPGTQEDPDFTTFLNDIRQNGGLTEEELKAVFRENSARLLDNAVKGEKKERVY